MLQNRLFCSVLLRCEGGFPERFLDAAATADIPLWDIRHRSDGLWCRAAAADYCRLRASARRACVRMRLQRRCGILFRLRRFRFRFGLLAGAALFFLVLQLLSSRIWVIRVSGNIRVDANRVLDALQPLGIYEGCDFDAVDIATLRLSALQQFPELTWLTVNRQGSCLTVEVRESNPTEPIPDNTPANLIAARDGVIVRVNAVSGRAVVSPGDAVTKGDLLISGVVDSSVGPQLKRAVGSVIARTAHTLTITVPFTETITNPHGQVLSCSSLRLFGLEIPLYASGGSTDAPLVTTEHHPLRLRGVPLPVGVSVTRRYYPAESIIHRTERDAYTLAEQRLTNAENTLRKTLTIEERNLHFEVSNTAVTITAEYTGTEELTIVSPLL